MPAGWRAFSFSAVGLSDDMESTSQKKPPPPSKTEKLPCLPAIIGYLKQGAVSRQDAGVCSFPAGCRKLQHCGTSDYQPRSECRQGLTKIHKYNKMPLPK